MFARVRMKQLIVTAVMSLMLLLSACTSGTDVNKENKGTGTEGNPETEMNQATEQVQEMEAGNNVSEQQTRVVSTIMGDVEVPLNPQRVVVNWYNGDVLAAGLHIVGYSSWVQETMPYYDELMATTKIENWEAEDVMALTPDLIVTYSPEDFDRFSKVAPVLVIEESVSSPDRTRFIAEAAGTLETAEASIAKFEAKLAEAKTIFKADAFAGKTFSIMEDWGPSGDWSGIAYETGSRGGTLVYKYLGLTYPDKLAELIETTSQGRGTLSYEIAHEYFGDYIIWFQQEGKASVYAENDIWPSIPAVKNGRVLEIPGIYQGLFYYDDVLSLTAQLDYLIEGINSLVE